MKKNKRSAKHRTLRDCERALELRRPNHQRAQDGEIWLCPCGRRFAHVCDEAEGCSWVEVARATRSRVTCER